VPARSAAYGTRRSSFRRSRANEDWASGLAPETRLVPPPTAGWAAHAPTEAGFKIGSKILVGRKRLGCQRAHNGCVVCERACARVCERACARVLLVGQGGVVCVRAWARVRARVGARARVCACVRVCVCACVRACVCKGGTNNARGTPVLGQPSGEAGIDILAVRPQEDAAHECLHTLECRRESDELRSRARPESCQNVS
jgi:hypothetical protein